MLVVRESTSSQRMHISVGKTRGTRVTPKPKTLFGEVTIEIATTPLSRPVRRQFTAVPPTSAYEGPHVRWYRASCGERRRRDTMAGTSTDTGTAGARAGERTTNGVRSGACG